MSKYDILRIGLHVFELIACLAGIAHWKKIRYTHWKWFTFYLLLVFLLDILGNILHSIYGLNNAWVYNWMMIPGSFLFFFWFFGKSFRDMGDQKWIIAATVIYCLCFLAGITWLKNASFVYFSFSYCAGNILLLVLILRFLFKFIRTDEILNYRDNGMFWVCIGLLVFYMGSLPFYGLWNTLRFNYPRLFNNYWVLQISLDYLMYLFFTISFIWGKPK